MNLDRRTLRLIAVGASVGANCQPCLQINVGKARESGAEEADIAEAVEVGKMVREGAASKMDAFAAGLFQADPDRAESAVEGCACGEKKASAA